MAGQPRTSMPYMRMLLLHVLLLALMMAKCMILLYLESITVIASLQQPALESHMRRKLN